MKLDSEKQRELLILCLDSAQLTGITIELMRVLTDLAEVRKAVESAMVTKPDEAK